MFLNRGTDAISIHSQLRDTEGKEDSALDPWIARKLLFPIARGLCVNWETGNRREAGEALSHITNSGSESAAIVSAMSKTLKKVRLLVVLQTPFYSENPKSP